MDLKFEKEGEDSRGKFVFCSYGDKKISIFEIKKGFSRGGYSWKREIIQNVILGKIEYRTQNIETDKETVRIIEAPFTITLRPQTADLITALEDSVLSEISDKNNQNKLFSKFRDIIEKR